MSAFLKCYLCGQNIGLGHSCRIPMPSPRQTYVTCTCSIPIPFRMSDGTYCAECSKQIGYEGDVKVDYASLEAQAIATQVRSVYWYKEVETSTPTVYPKYLTAQEAEMFFKGSYMYARVTGVDAIQVF